MQNFAKILILLSVVLGLTGCGQPFAALSLSVTDSASQETPDSSTEADPETPPLPGNPDNSLKICSQLNFDAVTWSKHLSSMDQSAFQLALNISGSFEGHVGWANLTNNFDGQGLSMGLLNQTLGTGSLQPLLTEMRTNHFSQMQALFSGTRFQSLSDMLTNYGSVGMSSVLSKMSLDLKSNNSKLDTDWESPIQLFGAKEAACVTWAVQNLYNGTSFKPEWSKELTALATHPQYVSLQIKAAELIHAKARTLQNTLGLKDLRSYLVMFDFVVQNGGLGSQEIPEYLAYVKSNPGMTTTQKLQKILELRLRRVKPEYVSDVRSRKTALIMGAGTVHGANRKLEKEYCYQGVVGY